MSHFLSYFQDPFCPVSHYLPTFFLILEPLCRSDDQQYPTSVEEMTKRSSEREEKNERKGRGHTAQPT
jgi:hypothetical protein